MEIRELSVRFTETAADEVNQLITELRLIPIAQHLQRKDVPLPEELKEHIVHMLAVLTDLFSVELPDILGDPETTLRTVSRDINLARLLRERGLFRLYRLVSEKVWVDEDAITGGVQVPMFMMVINPNTGSPFARQEEFISWFCEEAHVARSLVFQRIATIDRLLALGFDLKGAFNLVVTRPYIIRETLNSLAKWDRGGVIEDIDPEKAVLVARRLAPESLDEIEGLAAAAREDPSAKAELVEAVKPLFAALLEEVSNHERSKDALDFVKHDILMIPEIRYEFDVETHSLLIELVRKGVDPETGQEYLLPPIKVEYVPDTTNEIPGEILADLVRRLPIRNRTNLDA